MITQLVRVEVLFMIAIA